MTQRERLVFLTKHLICESDRYNMIEIPSSEKELFMLYRSLVNVRMPNTIDEEYLRVEDEYLKNLIEENGITKVEDLTESEPDIFLWQGDITTLRCDAIVNAANSQMLGCFVPCHNCIDNCIHTFSGIRLRMKCAEIMKKQGHEEPTGTAKITSAYNLPCKYILHTVGPIVNGELTENNCIKLESCYRSCLELAEKHEIKSIAFCCISTGVFGFPQKEAAEIAVKAVRRYKSETKSNIKVIFNVFKNKDKIIYENILG
ncbi:MAG: protein-ADP-ribose hydrolase [Clostridia bacterium]|nr:protein-ADP-ribose hydrolase [Clostridia bacterium]